VHVSLFTRLTVPPDLRAQVKDDISRIACEQASFHFDFEPYPNLWGKCVALKIQSDMLCLVRSKLNNRWMSSKIVHPQERRSSSYQPHVTIHGRVSKHEARVVFQKARKSLKARVLAKGCLRGQAIGIQLWEYHEGQPWTHIASFPFASWFLFLSRSDGPAANGPRGR